MSKAYSIAVQRIVAVCALLALQTACFDLETEVRILPDGSGFITSWVRVNNKDATLITSLGGMDLNSEIEKAVANLRAASETVKGVDFLDNAVYSEGETLVLRYRYVFDNVGALNAFWGSSVSKAIPILLTNAKLEFQAGGGKCGAFTATLTASPRDPREMFAPLAAAFPRLDPSAYDLLMEKYYSGNFRLRVVPPGAAKAVDAPYYDLNGTPVYEKKIMAFFREGISARVRSVLPCDGPEGSVPDDAGKTITIGPAPRPADVALALSAIPRLAKTNLEFKQTGKNKGDVRVAIETDASLRDAMEFYLPLFLAIFPNSREEMLIVKDELDGGRARYRIETLKPVDFSKIKNPVVFLGRDGGRNVFRMQVPKFPLSSDTAADAVSFRVMTVKATLMGAIKTSNAAEIADNTATWVLTNAMMKTPVTLEAIAP